MSDLIHKRRLERASAFLLKEGIDAWIIVTSEGSDPSLRLIAGVETVGLGVFLITKQGERIAICSSIDAQDIVESDLFSEVKTYQGNAEEVVQQTIESLQPTRVAINFSENEPIADGLTTGRFRWLKQTLEKYYPLGFESAEPIIQHVIKLEN
jgi:hypothetical protein